MLIFYQAFDSEHLFVDLLRVTQTQPLASVFSQEHFLVANTGVERWLAQRLAQHNGVFAHYHFSRPEPFFHALNRQLSGENSLLTAEQLLWPLENLLRNTTDAVFAPLQIYLSGENAPIKRYQLAERLSQLFYQYQQVRADLLDAWQHGYCQTTQPAERWQQALWQKIVATQDNYQPIYQATIAQLWHAPPGQFRYQLPERLFVFAVSRWSPVEMQYLQAIAQHIPVYFYSLQPILTATHPLLASLGQQGQAFWHTAQAFSALQLNVNLLVATPKNQSILTRLQTDLARFAQGQSVSPTAPISLQVDDSISIHACHSRMREVEVVKNQLIEALEKHPDWQLSEIAILAPHIEDYAPYLHAVFDDIPHSISSPRAQAGTEIVRVFCQFLTVCQSRFGWQSVVDLLEKSTVYPRFGLSETDVALIKHWLTDTQVRWGQSAEHKRQFDLPPLSENTWQASLDRLLMGYAVGQDSAFVADVLPYKHVEGSSAQALGGLCAFLELLFSASAQCRNARTLADWGTHCQQFAEAIFTDIPFAERQLLQDLCAELAEQTARPDMQIIDLQVIIHWLEQQISQQTVSSGLLRGVLTCCSLSAVRGVPFQLVILMGMNEGEFPRVDKLPTFDLIAQCPRAGDFSRRADDRQQFLEGLFAAQQQLVITYIGQSLGQNQPMPPSVVVSELLDVLENDYGLKKIVVQQPLQAFSRRYFEGHDVRLFSYAQADCDTARALASEKSPPQPWWQGRIAPHLEQVIELPEFFSFLRQPQRYFLRRQLDLHLQSLADTLPEREPFALEGLARYAIIQEWLEALLMQQSFTLDMLRARGVWLAGTLGAVEFAQIESQLLDFVEQIKSLNLGQKIEPLAVDIACGDWRLVGKLAHRHQRGSLFYRYAPLKGKDFFIALLHHVLRNQQPTETTYLLSADCILTFPPELASPFLLEQLIDLYVKGQQTPTAFFPDCVLTYIRQAAVLKSGGRAKKSALATAQEQWQQTLEQSHQLAWQRLFTGLDANDVLNDDFVAWCETVGVPLWEKISVENL